MLRDILRTRHQVRVLRTRRHLGPTLVPCTPLAPALCLRTPPSIRLSLARPIQPRLGNAAVIESRQGLRVPRVPPTLQPERGFHHQVPRQQLHRRLSGHPVDRRISPLSRHPQDNDLALRTSHDRRVP